MLPANDLRTVTFASSNRAAAAKLRTHSSNDLSQGDIVDGLLRWWDPDRLALR